MNKKYEQFENKLDNLIVDYVQDLSLKQIIGALEVRKLALSYITISEIKQNEY